MWVSMGLGSFTEIRRQCKGLYTCMHCTQFLQSLPLPMLPLPFPLVKTSESAGLRHDLSKLNFYFSLIKTIWPMCLQKLYDPCD
jgi:hypothetical protein